MLSDEEKKKREEEAKAIINRSNIGDTINSINYANSNNIKIENQNEDEQNFINKINEANDIINFINPRQNEKVSEISDENKVQYQQNAQRFLDLIDGNISNIKDDQKTISETHANTVERKSQTKSKEEIDRQITQAKNQTIVSKTNKNNSFVDKDIKINLANSEETQNAKELSTSDINTMNAANQKNTNIKKGGVDSFNEWADTVLNNIYGGSKQAVSGLVNVVTTIAGFGIRGLEGASRIVGLNDIADTLNNTYNKIVDSGSTINERANYERNVNSQVKNDFVKTSGDISNVISNMIGNTVIGYATGVSGTVIQGLSVGGNSAQEVLDENKNNIKQATLTGIAKGYTSYLTERMFDANILTRGSKRTSIQEGINRIIANKINSKLGKEVANKTVGIIGENLEELAEDNAGYLIDKLVNNKELPSFEQWWANTSETAKTTTLSTVIMGLLGLGGESFSDIEMDMETEYWIDQAQQIIEQEDLAIHFNPNEVKNLNETEQFYITKFSQDGEISNIVPTIGKPIYNPNTELDVIPVVVRDSETKFYNIIDGNTGVILDNTYYATTMEAEGSFNEKANKLTDLQVKDINKKISEANYMITDKIISTITEAQNRLAQNNIKKTSDINTLENTSANVPQTTSQPNTSNFYSNETNYAVQDIKKVTEPFSSQEEYTKNEMADIWNNEISENEYDVLYDNNGNIQSYIAIEEEGKNLVVNQYDNEDNVIKSEIIPSKNGKYTSKAINNILEKVASVYDENRPIKGQVDVEGNEVRNMKINNATDDQIRDIVKYNQDGREIKDLNYVDFMVERYKDRINISDVETNTSEIEQLLDSTFKQAQKILQSNEENKVRNKQKELMIKKLYSDINDKEFTSVKKLRNENGIYETKKLNIEISKNGLKESFNKSISDEKYAVVPFLDKLIKTATDGTIRSESKNRRNIDEWYYLYNTAIVNDQLYSVKIDIKKTSQGDKFYVHRLNIIKEDLPSTSVSIVGNDTKRSNDKSSIINNSIPQKTKSVKSDTAINKQSMQKNENNTSKKQNGGLSKTKYDSQGRELTFKQAQYFKDSKAVDKNGNLEVVYHGTNNAGFTEFKRNINFYTNNKEVASTYTGNNGIYEGYVNIQNPIIVEANGEKWSMIDIDNISINGINNIKEFLNDYGASVWNEKGKTRTSTIDIVTAISDAIDDGKLNCDGVIINNIYDEGGYSNSVGEKIGTDYVTFKSNQFKNITNEAPTSNNDIRYMKKENKKPTQNQKIVDNQGRELSKQQQEYFKDSKVRDEKGNLKTMYHGSNNKFSVFKHGEAYRGSSKASVGYWFTETAEGAKNFANSVWYGDTKTGAKIYEVYLDIKKPKIYEGIDNTNELHEIDNKIDNLKEIIRKLENKNIAIEINKQELRWANSKEELRDIAKYEGIDFEDAENYHNAIKQYNELIEEYDNKKYNDSYEMFRTDIYKISGKSANEANIGGTGMYLSNEEEVVKQYVEDLKKQGYDGIIIKNTKFDNETLGKDNSQYVVFNSNQIKNVDNTNPTSNEDIRFAKRTAKSQNSNTEKTQRNAERQGSYIEQEIQKIEAKGNWDDTIPVTKLTDIRKTIEDYLGLGIKKGHFRQSAYAIYKGNRDVIRTKEYKDMDSILHETGHALDIGKRLNVDKESIANELLTAIDKLGGYEDETRTIRLEEGFAEVIREYSIIPDQAKIEYPQTVSVIEKIRQNDKSFDNFINKVQQQTYNYIHQNPRNRVLSNQSIGEQTDKQPLTKEWIKQETMRNIYDKDYATKSAVRELAKAGGKTVNQIKASENAYLLTRLANGIGDKVTSMLSDGYIDENGNKLMPGLNQIGEILGNDPQKFDDLRAYLAANRDVDYKAKDLKMGLRSADSKAVIEQFKNDIQIQKASKIVYDTLDGVLQYAVNNNLITQENADKLRESNAFYVPMQRVLENRGNQVGRKGAVSDIIKARTGSELDTKDILENIIANSSNIIQQVENNNILKALYKQGEASEMTGAIYDVIATPMTKVGTEQLKIWEGELKKQGIDTTELDLEKTIDLFAPNNKVDSQNLITSFINDDGKRVYLQFNDEILFNSIMNMDKKFMSQVLKINSKMNMPLRYGATMANIGFAIPNMISDTAQAAIFSTAGFVPVVDNALGVLDILTATNDTVKNFVNKVAPDYANRINALYTIYQQTGATSATRLSQYRKSTQEIMKEVYGTKKSENLGIKESFKPLKRLLDLMTYIPEISEQSTRFEVFKKNYDYYKNKGNSEMDARIQAAIESRDATQDFGRTGNITREINQLIPFSAARVGSSYTFAEKVTANPKQVGMRIAILTALAMAVKAIGYDDKEIEELNQRKKDDNFVFKIGDNVVTIKKPQGILRSMINLTEYIQDLATGHIEEGKEGERLGEWLNNAIMDNMPADSVTGLVPNMVAPLIENAINKDFYYNTDIVKSYDLELPDSEQYYDYNSQLAIWLGKIFNYSPAKIDNLISGYFAGLGTQMTDIMDYWLGKSGITAEQPEMGAEDNAVGKRFIVNVNSNSSSIDEIYNRKTELTKMKNGGTISKEEEKELETITEALANISNLNKQIKEIKKDLSMSGKEKANEIKLLQQEKTDTARKALGKELIYPENESKISSTQFYPNDTLKKNGYSLSLNSEQKKEYEQLASEYYKKYESQGLYSEDKLEDIKIKAKDYAKNQMFKKYKSDLVKVEK